MSNSLTIKNEFIKFGIEISTLQSNQFSDYFELLVETNKVLNLTAITELNEVIIKHFIDSIFLLKVYDLPLNSKLIDVGTGAGFPGIPLKILRPDLDVTLLDSLNKRLNFLDEVIRKLGLTNISTIHARAEEGGQDSDLRESFDYSVSRAVSQMNVLLEYCTPFLKVGGHFIAYKSKRIKEELAESANAMKILNMEEVESIAYPILDYENNYTIFKKFDSTPIKYPRRAAAINKSPLI